MSRWRTEQEWAVSIVLVGVLLGAFLGLLQRGDLRSRNGSFLCGDLGKSFDLQWSGVTNFARSGDHIQLRRPGCDRHRGMASAPPEYRALRNRRLVGAGVLVAQHTRFGRYIYLIGGGEPVARNSGIPVRRYKVYAFILSGLIAGFGGVLAVARLGAAGPTLGQDLLLNSLAAIVVGGTSLSGGVGGPDRTLARGVDHYHPGQWIEPARCKLLSPVGHQRCSRHRRGPDQPKPTTRVC